LTSNRHKTDNWVDNQSDQSVFENHPVAHPYFTVSCLNLAHLLMGTNYRLNPMLGNSKREMTVDPAIAAAIDPTSWRDPAVVAHRGRAGTEREPSAARVEG